MEKLSVSTSLERQVIDITDKVNLCLSGEGVATVLVAHTTAAITTADLDPGTDQDLLDALHQMLPKLKWRHPHNPEHTPAHLLSSIIGPSVSVPYSHGELLLGTWQRLVLLEFDGPRERAIHLSF